MKQHLIFCLLIITFSLKCFAQTFPNPADLSTGQGVIGGLDPVWQTSGWFASGTVTPADATYTPALINNNCAPSFWVDPSSLAPPVNNGNWITNQGIPCETNTSGGYMFFRLPLTLPETCGSFDITDPGVYSISFTGYVDNTISEIFVNGVPKGISGGTFSPGNGLSFTINGPWNVGINYIDVLVYNIPNGNQPNPYGLLLLADANTMDELDSDGDGVSNLYDLCPCVFGYDVVGCDNCSASISGGIDVCQNSVEPTITFTGINTGLYQNYTFTYNINGGINQTISTTNQNSVIISVPTNNVGTFVYELVDVTNTDINCTQQINETQVVLVNPLPAATIAGTTTLCQNAAEPQITFTGADGEEPYNFTYNINGGPNQYATSTGSIATFQVPTNTVGDFVYTITNVQEGSALGCQQAQSEVTMVTIHALPIVDAGADLTICAGVDLVLTGSGAQTYVWDNGVINDVPFSLADTTTFTVVGTDHNGCQDSDQMTVDVVPIPVMIIDGQDLSGCAPVTPILTNNSTGNLVNCTWYLGNGDTIQSCGVATSVFPDAGCYDVTLVVSTPEGCTNSQTINQYICVDPVPVASFYPKPSELSTYDWESQMINESSVATIFQWNYGDGTPIENGTSPTHGFPNEQEGEYTIQLVASSPNGCVDTTYGKITVKEELLFYIPNTFTPDGNEFNETFKPIFTTGYDPYHYELLIFDRWGEIVFESHDISIGWNGQYGIDGKTCQDGTYTWKISVKRRTRGERKDFVGHLNLLR